MPLRTHLAFDSLSCYAAVLRCTTGVQNTHKSIICEVQYQWHPWYGRSVCVEAEARRAGYLVWRCVLAELNGSTTLEIPKWMFDAGVCCRMRQSGLAYASSSALQALKCLMLLVVDGLESSVSQAQHVSRISGGADVDPVASESKPRRVVSRAGAAAPHTADAYQRMVRLLARMLNEHLQERRMDGTHVEVGDE